MERNLTSTADEADAAAPSAASGGNRRMRKEVPAMRWLAQRRAPAGTGKGTPSPRRRVTRLACVGLTAIVALTAGFALEVPHALAATFPGYEIAYTGAPVGNAWPLTELIGPDGTISTVQGSQVGQGNMALATQSDGNMIGAFKAPFNSLTYFTSPANSDRHSAVDKRHPTSDNRNGILIDGSPSVAAATAADPRCQGDGCGPTWAIAVNRRMPNDENGTGIHNELQILGSHHFKYVNPDFPYYTGELMLPGSSPAIASFSLGIFKDFVVAFLDPDGKLRTETDRQDHSQFTGLQPAPNTNPAIAADNNGAWMVALHGANNNNLWTLDSNGGVQRTAAVLAPNTSPAIVGLAHGGYAIAYVNADGTLWKDIRACISCSDVLSPAGPFQAVPAPGSSPSIAADNNGGWKIALQGANNHWIWAVDSDGHITTAQRTMVNGTESPAIAGITQADLDPTTGYEANSITYDTAHAVVTSNNVDQIDKVTNRNDSAVQQSTTVSGSKTVAEQEGWSRTESLAVKVSTTFSTGIPIFLDGKVSVEATVTNSYTESGSVTRTEVFNWSQPVLVPPRSIVDATVTVTHATVSVPYTLTGTFITRSGFRVAGTLHGTFTGASSNNLVVVLTQTSLDGTPAAATVHQPAPATLKESVNH